MRLCMTALVDRLQHTGRCILQFSVPSFRMWALALSCRVQANWAPLPSLPLQWCWNQSLSPKSCSEDGWWHVIEVDARAGLMSKSQDFIHGFSVKCKGGKIFTFSVFQSHLLWCWVWITYFYFSKEKTNRIKNFLLGWFLMASALHMWGWVYYLCFISSWVVYLGFGSIGRTK